MYTNVVINIYIESKLNQKFEADLVLLRLPV